MLIETFFKFVEQKSFYLTENSKLKHLLPHPVFKGCLMKIISYYRMVNTVVLRTINTSKDVYFAVNK